jgi:2-C-methyl-D-erythritol 4-phosphate cytidylyltransferase
VQRLEALVLVINEDYRDLDFIQAAVAADARIKFADPGSERQDSVSNGLAQVPEGVSTNPSFLASTGLSYSALTPPLVTTAQCTLVAVHDAARPLVTLDEVHRCLCDGAEHGAAVLGVPMKATVKESEDGQFVARTLQRSKLWEIQTPQVSGQCGGMGMARVALAQLALRSRTISHEHASPPQVVRPQLLRDGFKKVQEESWEVTDDVSIVELMGKPVSA